MSVISTPVSLLPVAVTDANGIGWLLASIMRPLIVPEGVGGVVIGVSSMFMPDVS